MQEAAGGKPAATALVLLALLGCHRAPEKPPDDATPARVTLVAPERRSLTRAVEQPGTIQADEATALVAKISGYVAALHADIGKRVKVGDVLIELSVPELDEEAAEKEAVTRQAAAEVVQAEKALASARSLRDEVKAGVGRAEAMAERWGSEKDRVAGLAGRGVIDEQTRDETLNQHKAAKAGLDEAKARVASAGSAVEKADADVLAAKAKQDVASAAARRVKAMAGYKRLVAPYDGVVTARDANTGDLVGPGRTLLSVARLDKVRAVVQVPEADAGLVREGAEISLSVSGHPVAAKVSRSAWALSPGARTLRVEADLANADGALRPGAYVTARLVARLPEAWTVPASAVARLGDVVAVYRVEGGRALQTPVELGHADGDRVEVRRWRVGAAWAAFTGVERVAEKAAGLYDGRRAE